MSTYLPKKYRKFLYKMTLILFGNFIYACGINLAISPLHFYSGGFTGIAQLIQLFFINVLHLPQIPGFGYVGILYFLLNLPFFAIAYRIMGKRFCFETFLSIALVSVLLAVIPIPNPAIIKDPMLASIFGGLGSGVGAGMILRAGSSQGGQDLIGVCLAKTRPNFKVGTIGIFISLGIYSICLFLYDVNTVLYSIIFACISGIALNRVHIQNIKMEAMIFTKNEGIAEAIIKELGRGCTRWDGIGAYTDKQSHVLITVISKYEEPLLNEILNRIDPSAFVIFSDRIRTKGKFLNKFTEV